MDDTEASARLTGRIALVTGAAGGLGSALCHALARRGVSVVACDVDLDGLQQLADVSRGGIAAWHMDLTDPEDIARGIPTCFDSGCLRANTNGDSNPLSP